MILPLLDIAMFKKIGRVIGTRYALRYANVFMGKFDQKPVDIYNQL